LNVWLRSIILKVGNLGAGMVAFPSRVLVIADYEKAHFDERLKGNIDFVLSLGDVSFSILEEILDLYRKPIFGVKGNHDPSKTFPEGVEDVHRTIVQHRKWMIGGYQGVPTYKSAGSYQWDDAQAAFDLEHFPYVDIFICHAPIYKITDKADYAHGGSEAIRRYIEQKQPRYVYHGHVHSQIGAMLGQTAVVSVFGAKVFTLT